MKESDIFIPKKNPRSRVTANKYSKQIQWRQNKVHELLARGYSQREISSTLHISQPTVSRDISFVKNNFQKEFDPRRTSKKLTEDLFIANLSFNELKKNLWKIVDNEKINDRVKIKAMKQFPEITIQALELIPIAESINMIEDVEEKLKEREENILAKEKILEAHRIGTKLSWKELRIATDKDLVF